MLGSPAASPIGGTPAAAPHDAGTPETIPAGERVQDRASKITTAWWVGWIVSAGLIVATLARGFGGSLQAIADTVELHIAVDLMAAVVAGLGTAMLLRFARTFTDRSHQYDQWVVQPPAPTRRRS
jgi:hypothetical protein